MDHGEGSQVLSPMKVPMVGAKVPRSGLGWRLDRRAQRLWMDGTLMQAKVTMEKVPRSKKLPEGWQRQAFGRIRAYDRSPSGNGS